ATDRTPPDRPATGGAATVATGADAGPGRGGRIAGLALAAAATAYVGLVDPARGGVFPLCPSRLVLGLDCPACGGLRGTHDLLHGHLGQALDHNLLLPAYLLVLAAVAWGWVAPLVGRRAPALRAPRWATAAALVVVVAFTVARNLPGLDYLGSGLA
ncbi:MAG TPA: DUF2752 domain-containing protein, partial [Acidimicrobiales bacterium]|nr:DUF2752 domain-containing protein [Acidimicrobiales bacterium]